MRAYQIKVNGNNYSLPFAHNNDVLVMLARMADETTTVEEVEIGVGDYYRNGNVIYMKDDIFKGVVKGVYYKDHAESI